MTDSGVRLGESINREIEYPVCLRVWRMERDGEERIWTTIDIEVGSDLRVSEIKRTIYRWDADEEDVTKFRIEEEVQ